MSAQTPVWFIAAASSGFGKYIALEALKRGHRVIASARSTSRISDLADAGAVTLALDVTWPQEQIEKVAKEANDKYGYINHLVNAAGYILVGAVEETSPKEDYDHFNTNVFGTLNTCKAFLPYLRSTPGHRTISNFGSIGSWVGGAGYALYSGTKFAISGISEGLRAELAPLGIAVTVVEPGYFRTGFLNASARVSAAKTIQAYEDSVVGSVRRRIEETDNRQRGDVEKGCKVIVDILTREGVAEGKEVPERVVLGSDAPGVVRGKLERTEALLKEWEGVTTNTDHE
ncbi:NAD(P)-binding protein [Westerdykella ornata]|uniref:NAD(P)-binding protein n=1 Tax=Westerdykella ornata TaxID=318751 RepID=A0A6A6JMJ0_WESOR|nr:NAD(P)-binding protein [Westerdykella ornata]KAF2277712.1 NAD(P)-binding protein [Westerdykella ornata]